MFLLYILVTKKNVLLNEMNCYEDMKEHTRRRELGFNANNPWSLEKEANLKQYNQKIKISISL